MFWSVINKDWEDWVTLSTWTPFFCRTLAQTYLDSLSPTISTSVEFETPDIDRIFKQLMGVVSSHSLDFHAGHVGSMPTHCQWECKCEWFSSFDMCLRIGWSLLSKVGLLQLSMTLYMITGIENGWMDLNGDLNNDTSLKIQKYKPANSVSIDIPSLNPVYTVLLPCENWRKFQAHE